MIFNEQTKSIPITKMMVWEAYKKVRSNKGSAGVDQQTLVDFDKVRSKALYKIWNRLSSGSYFPPEVKRVEIRKQDGKTRPLGIPKLLSYYMSSQFVLGMFSDIPIKYL